MWKATTEKFKKPKEGGAYLAEVTQIAPSRHIHPKSVFIDLSEVDKRTANRIRKAIERNKGKITKQTKGREPLDYGITEEQFTNILDKASQPIEKPKSDSETTQT